MSNPLHQMRRWMFWPILIIELILILSIPHCFVHASSISGASTSPTCYPAVAVCQGPPVTITSANIINGDSVTLIPAQGANTYITLVGLTAQYKAGTLPFGVAGYQIFPFFAGTTNGFDCANFTIPSQLTTAGVMGGACDTDGTVSSPNLALNMNSGVGPLPGGAVASATVTSGNAGVLYAPGDTGTLITCGDDTAIYTVAGVGAGGAVTSVTVSGGTTYTTQGGCLTTPTTGAGNGALQLDLTAANGNGSIIVTPIYTVVRTQ